MVILNKINEILRSQKVELRQNNCQSDLQFNLKCNQFPGLAYNRVNKKQLEQGKSLYHNIHLVQNRKNFDKYLQSLNN